jgi:hypothetical protein
MDEKEWLLGGELVTSLIGYEATHPAITPQNNVLQKSSATN